MLAEQGLGMPDQTQDTSSFAKTTRAPHVQVIKATEATADAVARQWLGVALPSNA